MVTVTWITHYPWHRLLETDVSKLVNIAQQQRAIKPEKLLPLIEKMKRGGEMDAPIISKSWGKPSFTDGIHRTIAAAQMGLATIKIAVLPEELDDIQDYLNHL